MKKICMIGDSHMGCMRIAFKKNPRTNIDLTFFGASASWTEKLIFNKESNSFGIEEDDDDKLKNQLIFTSGDPAIYLSKYDEFYFVRGSYRYYLELFDKFNIFKNKIENINYPENLLSESLLKNVLKEYFMEAGNTFQFLSKLKKATNKPITYIVGPCVSKSYLKSKNFMYKNHPEVISNLYKLYKETILEIYTSIDIPVIFQPESTLEMEGFTKEEFTQERYGDKGNVKNVPDFVHMDSSFGEIILNNIIPKEEDNSSPFNSITEYNYIIEMKKCSLQDNLIFPEGIGIVEGVNFSNYSDLDYYLIFHNKENHEQFEYIIAKGNRKELTLKYFNSDIKKPYIYDKGWFATKKYRGLLISDLKSGIYELKLKIELKNKYKTIIDNIKGSKEIECSNEFYSVFIDNKNNVMINVK